MSDYADADLVLAIVKPADHLKERAEERLSQGRLTIPFSVGMELLFVAHKFNRPRTALIAAAAKRFDIDNLDILLVAADALDEGDVTTVFDAVHAAQAFIDGQDLHTTDRRLLASAFPTKAS